MIDGVNLRIRGRAQQRLRSHRLLEWKSEGLNMAGVEAFAAKWEGFTFTGDATRCTKMRGSFHKSHQGGTNWQDFTREQFAAEVQRVCLALGLHDAELPLSSVEVGVNIVPPIPTPDALRCIVLHGKAHSRPMNEGAGITIEHIRYKFKIYDKVRDTRDKARHVRDHNKARLHALHDELLRAEVRARASVFKPMGIRTLADLLTPQAWAELSRWVVERFDELLIVEPGIPTDGLKASERELLARAGDANYWTKGPPDGLSRWQRCRKRKELDAITARHDPPGLKATLRASIVAKLEELVGNLGCNVRRDGVPEHPSCTSATFVAMGDTLAAPLQKGPPATFVLSMVKATNVAEQGARDPCSEVRHDAPAQPARRCLACGRDISAQDPRSRVCSERIHGKAGKACRNKLSNRSLTLRRMAERGGLLFDERPFVAVATSNPPQPIHVNAAP